MRFIFILLLSLFAHHTRAQETRQKIWGKISNASSYSAVANATVSIIGTKSYETTSDSLGYYEVSLIPGNYSIEVKKEQFQTLSRNNILVYSGKQEVQNFQMLKLHTELKTININSQKESGSQELNMLSFQRIAANFYDPGRLVTSYANAINANDQANSIVVRGVSPTFVKWKIEGVEVVNPNHLENAGTQNDLPSINAGGVSIFSGQVMRNSNFYYAPVNHFSGNSASSSYFINFRDGNNKKFEHISQTSLLGIDFSSEGPLSKNHKASYLINGRYSTVGLLSLMGLDFGDEKINYQDISYQLSFPHKKGQIKFYGVTGSSQNIFTGKIDSSLIEIQKEQLNISYSSLTSVHGLSSILKINNKSFLKTVFSFSSKSVSRLSEPSSSIWPNAIQTNNRYKQKKMVLLNYFSTELKYGLNLKVGATGSYFVNDILFSENDSNLVDKTITDPLIEPFISLQGRVKEKLLFKLGLTALYHQRLNNFILQPKLNLDYILSSNQSISLTYASGAQIQNITTYFNEKSALATPTISNYISAGHQINIQKITIRTELYYQYFHDIPVQSNNNYSAFNSLNEVVDFEVFSSGEARVYGFDLTLETYLKGFYIIASTSIYNSEYSIGNVWNSARFNSKYNTVLSIGKEFKLKKGDRYWSIDLKGIQRNGFLQVNPDNPTQQFYYTEQLPNYFRIDLRIAFRKNKEKSSSILSIDIQNLSNQQNLSYTYFDSYTQQNENVFQLGLIPVLSYKIFL